MRAARPRARGRNRFIVAPSSAKADVMKSSSATWPSLLTAFATAEARTLATTEAASRGVRGQDLLGAHDVLAADEVEHEAGLGGGHVVVPEHRAGAGALVGVDRRGHQRRTDLSWPAW